MPLTDPASFTKDAEQNLEEMKKILKKILSEEVLDKTHIVKLTEEYMDFYDKFRTNIERYTGSRFWLPCASLPNVSTGEYKKRFIWNFYIIRQNEKLLRLFRNIIERAESIESIEQKDKLSSLFDKLHELLNEITKYNKLVDEKNKIKYLKGVTLLCLLFISNPKIFFLPCGYLKQHKKEYICKLLNIEEKDIEKICFFDEISDFKKYMEVLEKSHKIAKEMKISSMIEFLYFVLSEKINEKTLPSELDDEKTSEDMRTNYYIEITSKTGHIGRVLYGPSMYYELCEEMKENDIVLHYVTSRTNEKHLKKRFVGVSKIKNRCQKLSEEELEEIIKNEGFLSEYKEIIKNRNKHKKVFLVQLKDYKPFNQSIIENITKSDIYAQFISRLRKDWQQAYLVKNEDIVKKILEIAGLKNYISSVLTKDGDNRQCQQDLQDVIDLLIKEGQIIFYGPVGTGKTFLSKKIAECISKDNGYYNIVTFHPSYEYEDFVEGLFPKTNNTNINYYVRNGIFKRIALQATIATLKKICSGEPIGSEDLKELCEDPCFKKINIFGLEERFEQMEKDEKCFDKIMGMIMDCEIWRGFKNWDSLPRFVLVIDEINRADVSRVFGELITLLEKDKRLGGENCITVTLPYSREKFGVPPNLYIIGTMNTTDRSIALIDLALRRRFAFKEIEPDPSLLEGLVVKDINIGELLKKLNERIKNEKGRDYQIGHAFFIELMKDGLREDEKERLLIYKWNNKVAPLLEEIFYGRNDMLRNIVGEHLYDEERVKRIDDVEELKKL